MILMTDTKYFTVSRAMLNFSSAHTQEIGSQFAYVVMSVIPMLIIYIVFHKQIEKVCFPELSKADAFNLNRRKNHVSV